ncbi:MAG TPA: BON domain-containing protein [Burkholderiales bacterium]
MRVCWDWRTEVFRPSPDVSRAGHAGVALRGMVDSARLIREAEDAALGVAGVAAVDNHLISADLFEHD